MHKDRKILALIVGGEDDGVLVFGLGTHFAEGSGKWPVLEEPSKDSRELQRVVANSAAASASICIRGLSWELWAWQGCIMRVGVRSNHSPKCLSDGERGWVMKRGRPAHNLTETHLTMDLSY